VRGANVGSKPRGTRIQLEILAVISKRRARASSIRDSADEESAHHQISCAPKNTVLIR